MTEKSYNASEAWEKWLLSEDEYSHHCKSSQDIKRIKRLGSAWSRIISLTKLPPSARLFELGCGGGIHLATLAVNGFDVHGIDVSNAVINRAQNYLDEVKQFQSIKASIETYNIFEYPTLPDYDLTYHFGVVEHFLESTERQMIWEKLYALTKPGGWIVSVVPNGQHMMRKMIRSQGLAGYNIPEIDYSCQSHRREFELLNLDCIHTIPHNYFSFLSHHPNKLISKIIYPVAFVAGNLFLPNSPLSPNTKEHWAQTLIVMGQKPLS